MRIVHYHSVLIAVCPIPVMHSTNLVKWMPVYLMEFRPQRPSAITTTTAVAAASAASPT